MSDIKSVVPIKPVMSDEGIELYASDEECGMSQRGLGRFAGVSEASIRAILESIVRGTITSECLKSFIGANLYCEVEVNPPRG